MKTPPPPPALNRVKRKADDNLATQGGNKKIKLNPGPETVLFIPHTPHSTLKQEIQKAESNINSNRATKVKIVERLGNKLSDDLCNKNPWKREQCGNTECVACCYSPGSCRKRNILYKATCVHCATKGVSSIYWGESHRGWQDRLAEHLKALATKNEAYATVRHYSEQHPEATPSFTFHYVASYMTSLERQIRESMAICRGRQL